MVWTHDDFNEMRKDWSDPTLVGWELIYRDGTHVTSAQSTFEAAPQRNVLFLIKYYRRAKGGHSREIQNGLDVYVLRSVATEEWDWPPGCKLGVNLKDADFFARIKDLRADTNWTPITKMI